MAADFVAETPLLDELSFESRAEAVNQIAGLVLKTERALADAPEDTTHVSAIGRTFANSPAKAIADRGKIVDGSVEHEIDLWEVDTLKGYLAWRRERYSG